MKEKLAISEIVDRFNRERASFIGRVEHSAKDPKNHGYMAAVGIPLLLQNLLRDPSPGIRTAATMTLGKLASHSETIANSISLQGDIITLIEGLETPIEHEIPLSKQRDVIQIRRASCYALRNVWKHGLSVAKETDCSGAVLAGVSCLRISDPDLREASAWLLDTIATQSKDLAYEIVDSGAIPALTSVLKSSEIGPRRAAIAALGSIAERSNEIACMVVNEECAKSIVSSLEHEGIDIRFIRNALYSISQMSQGGKECASELVRAGILPVISKLMVRADEITRRFGAAALRDLAYQDVYLAEAVVSTSGCLATLIHLANSCGGLNSLPAIMLLGHFCAVSQTMTLSVVQEGGIEALVSTLIRSDQCLVKSTAAWALGQLSKQKADYAKRIAETGGLDALVNLGVQIDEDEDLARKCTTVACSIAAHLEDLQSLDPLLKKETPVELKRTVIKRIDLLLEKDPEENRAAFVQSGGLKIVLSIGEELNSPLKVDADKLQRHYPQEVINVYSPSYNKALIESLSLCTVTTGQMSDVNERSVDSLPSIVLASNRQQKRQGYDAKTASRECCFPSDQKDGEESTITDIDTSEPDGIEKTSNSSFSLHEAASPQGSHDENDIFQANTGFSSEELDIEDEQRDGNGELHH